MTAAPFEAPVPLDEAGTPGENFTSVVTALRWTTSAAALIILSTGSQSNTDIVAGAVVLTYALWRTIRPVDVTRGSRTALLGILTEAGVMVSSVAATGYWSSPFVLGLFTVVSLAGFSGGIATSFPTAAACALAIALPYHVSDDLPDLALTVQWSGEIALVAIVTGYARRITLQVSAKTSAYLDRLQRLSEANRLLLQLHRVAATLPMSLDLGETLDSSVSRLRDLFEPDATVLLILDEASQWTVERASGVTLGPRLDHADLPSALANAQRAPGPHLVAPIPPGAGMAPGSTSGIYAPLRAREEVVGLIGVERGPGHPLGEPQLALMDAFAEQLAVAIDNARWFSRIGTLAAERERGRIARDLHDRVGQSLALVGFELDRAAKSATEEDLRGQVRDLRATVSSVVAELRETLYDLRTDVSEEYGVSHALTEFAERVGRRSELQLSLEADVDLRLPLAVEREIWRIAQEAITNVERHAEARSLIVAWVADDDGAVLRVADDGRGMPSGEYRRPGGYGFLGMQERADAIGATLRVTSAPGAGTEIRLTVARTLAP